MSQHVKKIKIGHIGLGHMHSAGKMDCVRHYPELFDVVGLAVPEEEETHSWTSYAEFKDIPRMTVEELLNHDDLNAVMVECDDWNLVKYAQLCVNAGKHIHLDKPAGESIPDFEKLIHKAKTGNLTVQLAYMYRYNPAVVKALTLARSGALGEILQVDALMSTMHSDEIRQWLTHFKGGTMHIFGCHIIDLLLLFQGMPDCIVPFNKKTMIHDIDVYDHDFAVFEYPKGISTVRTSSVEINGFRRRQLVVCGTSGTVEIKPLETGIPQKFTEISVSSVKHSGNEVLPIAGRYDDMMLDFASIVRGEKENPFAYEHELALQRACLKACGF